MCGIIIYIRFLTNDCLIDVMIEVCYINNDLDPQ